MKKAILLGLLISFNCYSTSVILQQDECDIVTIDRYSLQKIFTKRVSRWPDGQPIRVFIKPMDSVEHRDFVYNVLGMSPFYYQQALESQVYSGKTSSVMELPSDALMILKIETTPGAIGYINYEIYIGNKRIIVVDDDNIK